MKYSIFGVHGVERIHQSWDWELYYVDFVSLLFRVRRNDVREPLVIGHVSLMLHYQVSDCAFENCCHVTFLLGRSMFDVVNISI